MTPATIQQIRSHSGRKDGRSAIDERRENMTTQVRIGIIGDYNPDFHPHRATNAAIHHAADQLHLTTAIEWLPTPLLAQHPDVHLRRFDALWCAPGSPYQSMAGALQGIRFAREQRWPFIGTCGGFQHVVLEYARNVLGFTDAAHAESDSDASTLFVSALACSLVGKTMRVHLDPSSRVFRMYQRAVVQEQYYCQFGLNPDYQATIHEGGLRVVGVDDDQGARIVELPDHPFFVATLFVPPLTSTQEQPHPLILAFLQAAVDCCLAVEDERAQSAGP
jgi:CTP synthase (UTP-ammonia lyase)